MLQEVEESTAILLPMAEQEERPPPAGGGHREERKYRDDFSAGRSPDQRMEYEDSTPMERRPTLPVTEILAAEQQERSWERDREMVSPQRSRQRPRNRGPRHGWTEHRCASTPPEGRQSTPAQGWH